MNLTPGIQRFTAGGVLGATSKAKRVYSVSIYSATVATAGTVTLYNAASAGSTADVYLVVAGVGGSGNTMSLGPQGMPFPNGCYVLLSSTSGVTYASVVYNEEF